MLYDLTSVKKGWWSFGLPGYRGSESTYSLYPFEALPTIPKNLDANFTWLTEKPNFGYSLADGTYCNGDIPDLGRFHSLLQPIYKLIPSSFLRFIFSKELHQSIRSVTSCLLYPPDFLVKTTGVVEGYIFPFLADQQFCVSWFLHVSEDGKHFVAVSPKLLGVKAGDLAREIDISTEEVYYCSPSFPEFIYRYWLENEIAWSLYENIPLNPLQEKYVLHYKNTAM